MGLPVSDSDDDALFVDVWSDDAGSSDGLSSFGGSNWSEWEFEQWRGMRPMLSLAFYGWRERCKDKGRLRDMRHLDRQSRELRARLLSAARKRLWRWRLSRVLQQWCEEARLTAWARLRLARAADRLNMLRLHWAMAVWHEAAGCKAAEHDALERLGGAERCVSVVTALQVRMMNFALKMMTLC